MPPRTRSASLRRLLAAATLPFALACSSSASSEGSGNDDAPSAGDDDGGATAPGDGGATGTDADGGAIGIAFAPSNLPASLPSDGLGDVSVAGCGNGYFAYLDTDDGTLTAYDDGTPCIGVPASAFRFLTVDQGPSAPKLGVFVARNLVVPDGATVIVRGRAALVLVALDTIEVDGVIQAASNAGLPASMKTWVGGWTTGPGSGAQAVGWAGGTGSSHCGLGGVGGHGPAPAPAYGSPTLTPLQGGSGGAGSSGGWGGAAVQLVAGNAVVVGAPGAVDVGGYGSCDSSDGAGSGGAILVEAPTIQIAGTLAANGGAGGYGAGHCGNSGYAGDQPAVEPYGCGGTGSAGAVIDGGTGCWAMDELGAGGGGAGRIALHSASGQASISGVLSPSAASGCVAQATLPPR